VLVVVIGMNDEGEGMQQPAATAV
ncbi:hypothetical protein A2U01_0108184, partial [Trifolium medium]|nr:hypothetical protein [Trifolium medium]